MSTLSPTNKSSHTNTGTRSRGRKSTFLASLCIVSLLLCFNLWSGAAYDQRNYGPVTAYLRRWLERKKDEVTNDTDISTGDFETLKPFLTDYTSDNSTASLQVGDADVDDCGERSMGMSKFRQYMKDEVVLCEGGLSSIVCPSFYPREDGLKRAFFCYLRNAFEVMHPTTRRLHWIAQCKLQEILPRSLFFQELSRVDYMRRMQVVKELPAVLLGRIIVVEETDLNVNDFARTIKQRYNLRRQLPPLAGSFTYVINGDCNTGNPGHCQADPHLLYVVRTLLNFDKSTTRVILLSGFGRSNYLKRDVQQKDPQFFSDLQALASSIFIDAGHSPVYPHLLLKGSAFVQPLSLVATSPLSLYGPHWQGFRENRSCETRNPVLFQAQGELLLHQQMLWTQAPPSRGYGNLCSFMKRLESSAESHKVYGLEKPCDPPFNILYWVSRHGNGRHITNEASIVEKLSKEKRLNFTNFLLINPGLLDYADQAFLASHSNTIVGPHGGGMWEAVRWGSHVRGQIRVLEIMPMLGPGDSCVLATMMGTLYKSIECLKCQPGVNHSADMEYEVVLKALLETFTVSPDFTCKSLKRNPPKRPKRAIKINPATLSSPRLRARPRKKLK